MQVCVSGVRMCPKLKQSRSESVTLTICYFFFFFSRVLLLLCQTRRGWKQPTCWAFGSCGCEWAAIFVNTRRRRWAHINRHYQWNNERSPQCCSHPLHHWMALLLLLPSPLAPSFPPSLHALLFSLALSLRLLILCRRKIRIAREHNEDYQIDIGDNLFLPSLLHGLSLHFPLLSACATHSLSVVNLCFHPLPFKSLTPSGYVREPRERERERKDGGGMDR